MQNFFNRYFETSLQLIAAYNGLQPLNLFLKNYFSEHKKHGSKDRKWIAHFCYCYFRLGYALKNLSTAERLRVAVFLCTDKAGDWLLLYDEEWQQAYNENITVRMAFLHSKFSFQTEDIFYSNAYLSNGIDTFNFNKSHLVQPCLFIRIRTDKMSIVTNKFYQQNIVFQQVADNCLAIDNATKIDSIIDINKEAVVQDFSSQQIASFFSFVKPAKRLAVWDCCAASGGKSILAYDFFGDIKLTVSDIREAIIYNLRKRFQQSGIYQYQSFVADVCLPQFQLKQQYDLVICDAPCSGSGTWSRTPEQLCFFTEQKLSHYTRLQKAIAGNAVKGVKRNGYFLYITCSVFRQENEDVVAYLLQNNQLKLVKADVIKGYDKKADTMFATLFINQ